MADTDNLKTAAEAVKGIAEAIPVYQDVIQPAATEVGKALQTLAKTIHVVLSPVAGLVWGYEKISEYLTSTLAQKLQHVPPDRLITPNPAIAGPAVEALRFVGNDPSLRDLYSNLLASAIDASTAREAHPAFVEIIKQLSPDEARILKLVSPPIRSFPVISLVLQYAGGKTYLFRHFSLLGYEANCKCPELASTYLDNLCRLGLMEIPTGKALTREGVYAPLVDHSRVVSYLKFIESKIPKGERAVIVKEGAWVTTLGQQFLNACVIEHDAPKFIMDSDIFEQFSEVLPSPKRKAKTRKRR